MRFLLLLFLFYNSLNAEIIGQNGTYVTHFIETEYQYTTGYYDSVEITKCNGHVFPCMEFKGKLVPAIAYLWKKDSAFVRVVGEIPFDKIYYFISSIHCADRDALVEMTKIKMQKEYRFTITLYEDSADILSLDIIDPVKLEKFECSQIYGVAGMTKFNAELGFLDIHNMGLFVLTDIFKKNLATKIYLQVNDKIGYCLKVPSQIVKTNSLTVINKYLTENLGLELKKEKRLEEFLLLDFTK